VPTPGPAASTNVNGSTRRPADWATTARPPEVTPLINALCAGAPRQWIHHFLPTLKLEPKQRRGRRLVRQYGPAQTPWAWVLAAAEVSAETKARLQALHATLNPFQLARDIERQKKAIEARRRLPA
jgi:uncharacterized protein YdiU (UPF0061 family)